MDKNAVGELINTHPRFYSIGQMGNSKDNVHVFHDQDNEYECCVEVKDNQSAPITNIGHDNFLVYYKNSTAEMKVLAEQVLYTNEIRYCPHGRPVLIELSKYELEKQFGRIQ